MTRFTAHTLMAVSALLMGFANAAELAVGERLSQERVQALTQKTLRIGTQTLRVVGTRPNATLLADEFGAVGISRHDVVVSGATPELVRKRVEKLGLQPESADYYVTTGLSTLRFATLAEAMQARATLSTAMAGAVVNIPVEFAERVER